MTAAKTEQKVIDAAPTMSVITSETIQNTASRSYADLLRAVPGMNVARAIAINNRGQVIGDSVPVGPHARGIAEAEQVQGKELSYNNLNDANAALELVAEFRERLAVSRPTLPLAELLLTKLQIVKLNRKDLLDAVRNAIERHRLTRRRRTELDVLNGQLRFRISKLLSTECNKKILASRLWRSCPYS